MAARQVECEIAERAGADRSLFRRMQCMALAWQRDENGPPLLQNLAHCAISGKSGQLVRQDLLHGACCAYRRARVRLQLHEPDQHLAHFYAWDVRLGSQDATKGAPLGRHNDGRSHLGVPLRLQALGAGARTHISLSPVCGVFGSFYLSPAGLGYRVSKRKLPRPRPCVLRSFPL